MNMDIIEHLRLKDNPCRGIVLGMGPGKTLMQFAWIMGRSSNSQNRIYETDLPDADLRTAPADAAKVEDPKLIIYNAMKHIVPYTNRVPFHIVGNGDQTDTITDEIREEAETLPELSIVRALNLRHCEPDAPTFTSRITGYQIAGYGVAYLALLRADSDAKDHWISVVKSSGLTKDQFKKPGMKDSEITEAYNKAVGKLAGLDHQQFPTVRSFFEFPVKPGIGYCLTTYKPGSKALDSFDGEPFAVPIVGSLEASAMYLWNHLDDGGANWRVSIAGKEFAPVCKHMMFRYNTRQKV